MIGPWAAGPVVAGGGSSEFDDVLKWNRIMLRPLGIWPMGSESLSKFESLATVVLTLLLGVVVVMEWADLVEIWGQFEPMLENLSVNFGQSLALVKILVIRWNMKTLECCVDEVRNDWRQVGCLGRDGHTASGFRSSELNPRQDEKTDRSSARIKVMLHWAKVGRILSIAGPGFAIAAGVSYSVTPLTLARPTNGSDTFAPLPLRSSRIFQPSQAPAYQLTYLGQTLSCYVSSVAYSATDCLFTALALHACGQIEILEQIIRGSNANTIAALIERHLKLVRFVGALEEIFCVIILAQLLVSSLAICVIGYKFMTSLDAGHLLDTTKFLFYLTVILMQIFFYCHAGQCLIDENVRLSQAAYDCPWYKMSRSNARAFLLIQCYGQKPLQVTAFKFCVMSHDCFANILSTSATYLSVLRAIK